MGYDYKIREKIFNEYTLPVVTTVTLVIISMLYVIKTLGNTFRRHNQRNRQIEKPKSKFDVITLNNFIQCLDQLKIESNNFLSSQITENLNNVVKKFLTFLFNQNNIDELSEDKHDDLKKLLRWWGKNKKSFFFDFVNINMKKFPLFLQATTIKIMQRSIGYDPETGRYKKQTNVLEKFVDVYLKTMSINILIDVAKRAYRHRHNKLIKILKKPFVDKINNLLENKQEDGNISNVLEDLLITKFSYNPFGFSFEEKISIISPIISFAKKQLPSLFKKIQEKTIIPYNDFYLRTQKKQQIILMLSKIKSNDENERLWIKNIYCFFFYEKNKDQLFMKQESHHHIDNKNINPFEFIMKELKKDGDISTEYLLMFLDYISYFVKINKKSEHINFDAQKNHWIYISNIIRFTSPVIAELNKRNVQNSLNRLNKSVKIIKRIVEKENPSLDPFKKHKKIEEED